MNREELKDIIRFIVKKPYRETMRRAIHDSTIEKISQLEIDTEKKVMIIRRPNSHVGTFSDYIVFLKAIEYAIQQNKIPVIDRKTYKNGFISGDDKLNTWELFFEQPYKIGLDDIDLNSMNVEVCNCGMGIYPVSLLHCSEGETIQYWRKIASKYIRYTTALKTKIDKAYASLLLGKRVVGVSIREGYKKLNDMHDGVIWGHPIQASTESMIILTKEKMIEWNCEYVFFTCQTVDTVELFRREFGEKAICLDRKRQNYENLLEGKALKNRSYENAKENEEKYIIEMSLLSKCNSMICSHNSGSDAAFIMSDGFENMICLENGTYK